MAVASWAGAFRGAREGGFENQRGYKINLSPFCVPKGIKTAQSPCLWKDMGFGCCL